ncbi:VOC family protein [Croceitalea rosinachiae]|uniref:VOC family protein n=1 Tax=Croceitalea rosinachiae TaxID=3075596 RepID=A0ABU3ABA7_9FLAO|nr:VOC family protein [Croceitalea sp. F388]MDT0607115.1 VOC family protein [Croceitalea sp. F388]
MSYIINGIQQIGIGVSDAKSVFNWYKEQMRFDILLFEDIAEAKLMTKYTNHKIMSRYALLVMNMKGGGGLEIWQFKNRKPQNQAPRFLLGDIGINIMKLRSTNPNKSNRYFKDPWGNWIQSVNDPYRFCKTNSCKGGVLGAVIGVSNMAKSLTFYKDLIGFDIIKSDVEGVFEDLKDIPGGNSKLRRVIISRSDKRMGGFGRLLGPMELELVQVHDRTPPRIYQNRIWGDLGYIHLCFDISGMNYLKQEASRLGYPLTVDSADSFDMGDAAGRFGYVEDPDGTLIELVETHKVPIIKKLGIHINLKNRNPERPLPNWIVKAMRIHRKRKNL